MRALEFAKTRKFGGRRYDLYGRFDTKTDANKMVRKIRDRGRNARVVPAKMRPLRGMPANSGRKVYLVYTAENERRNPHMAVAGR